MKIKNIKHHTKKELIKRLHNVTLLKNESVFPYKEAVIKLESIKINDIYPSQFYFLQPSLDKTDEIKKALKENNLDLFNLNGYLEYDTADDNSYTFLPPIVEYQPDKNGKIVPILNDGVHRVVYARQNGIESIQVISVKNIDEKYPIMGYPNPNGWNDIKKVEKAPETKDKRIWRIPAELGYTLYRNFNSAFENVGKPRK